MKINRRTIREYYESLIDDAGNSEELLDRLEEIDDMILELECDIYKKIDEKDAWDIPTSYELDMEFMQVNRAC